MAVCKVKWSESRGAWYARPYLGRTPEGKPIQPYREFPAAGCEEDAQALADAWAASLTADGTVRSAILADLLDDYAEMRGRGGASPNSVRSYRLFAGYVRKFMPGALARELGVIDFSRFEQRLMVRKEDGGQGLGRNSVRNVHDFLRSAYGFFAEAGICDSNPLVAVRKPALERRESDSLDVADFAELDGLLRSAMAPDRLTARAYRRAEAAFASWMALRTGMRVGEVCAVRPSDVAARAGYVHVGGTVIEEKGRRPFRRDVTKGRKCRNIAVTPGDLETIGEFMALRREFCGKLPLSAPIVTRDGSCERPTSVSRAFAAIAREAGLPEGFSFHGLRHTHATWLLANGVDIKTVSERLGHADEATTLRTYAHRMPGRDAMAAAAFEAAAAAVADGGGLLQ